jgi:hypothetical protein
MNTRKFMALFTLVITVGMASATQQELPAELKDAVPRDSACAMTGDSPQNGAAVTSALPIRMGARDLGTIVTVQGACHCQSTNCDTLVYLRAAGGYRLAFKEKYASLHPMKIVKRGMPSLTGQFEVSAAKMETTVYDWDGKEYRPSLCATVVKGGRVPSISRHPCKSPAQ